ncbi:hypothetical protein E3N88_39971 [Mikania micrantha]|uniref:Aminotransferase-like plant mobile domain-containing protein n=1 Tax=Mikania micrantha TaxID=192012 RepID=A0A5N6LLC5_9ASTR|nr:hypothetical protein E3N88_39971 [Mikania micrantha]
MRKMNQMDEARNQKDEVCDKAIHSLTTQMGQLASEMSILRKDTTDPPEAIVHELYMTGAYKATYDGQFFPLTHQDYWNDPYWKIKVDASKLPPHVAKEGPLVNDLLFLAGSHRADYVFQRREEIRDGGLLRIRRGDEKLWVYLCKNLITENVLQYIRLAGFSGVIDCESRRLDSALIYALVERWRPETHTFHMPFGEVTVTLQDVVVLLGLPVDGNVVSGQDYHMTTEQIIGDFYGLTGILLTESAVNGQKINMPFILNKIKDMGFPENPTDLQCIQHARIIILLLIGGTLFPESSSNWVSAKYLNHIQDLSACSELSWASVVLSTLYRYLCKSININTNEIGGATILLQLWAWEKIPSMAPRSFQQIDRNKSYGAIWVGPLTYRDTVSHVVSTYRSELNSLSEFQFVWRPYDNIVHQVPDMCRNGQTVGEMDGMSQVYQRSTEDSVRDLASRYMEYANARHHMSYQPTHDSQPVKKTSSWVFQKWRRTSKNVGSSTLAEEQQPPQMAYTRADQHESYIPNRRSVHQQRVGKWAILDDESKNWSNDVEEFFVNGDAPF